MIEFAGTVQVVRTWQARPTTSGQNLSWLCAAPMSGPFPPRTGEPWMGYEVKFYVPNGRLPPSFQPGEVIQVRGRVGGSCSWFKNRFQVFTNLEAVYYQRVALLPLYLDFVEHIRSCGSSYRRYDHR